MINHGQIERGGSRPFRAVRTKQAANLLGVPDIQRSSLEGMLLANKTRHFTTPGKTGVPVYFWHKEDIVRLALKAVGV